MTANELRIGNWVLHTNGNGDFTFEIEEILAKGINVVHNGGIWFIKYEYIEPITITPEILEKCGFDYDASYDVPKVQKGNFILWGYENEFGANFGHIEQLDVSVKHLHQLQNLYFALCGEELNVQL